MLFENIPYTNFHDLNLDWIIKFMKKIGEDEEAQNQDISDLKTRMSDAEEWIDNYDPGYIRETVLSFLESILARMIFVEITDAGYIVYHIPENWDYFMVENLWIDGVCYRIIYDKTGEHYHQGKGLTVTRT